MSQPGCGYLRLISSKAWFSGLRAGERLAAVADELKIKRKLLYEWRDAYRAMGVAGLNRKRGPKGIFGRARQFGRRAGAGRVVRTGAREGEDRRA